MLQEVRKPQLTERTTNSQNNSSKHTEYEGVVSNLRNFSSEADIIILRTSQLRVIL